MTRHIKNIMHNSASITPGWLQIIRPDDNKVIRIIRIGSQINCNEDGIICDPTTSQKIKNIFHEHNIHNYELSNVHNHLEYSTQVVLEEDVYNEFIKSISENKI